jgi:hypothetical protein
MGTLEHSSGNAEIYCTEQQINYELHLTEAADKLDTVTYDDMRSIAFPVLASIGIHCNIPGD